MIDDPAPYGHLVDALIARTHLVKVSEEDLRALNPVEEPLATASRWAKAGPELVVVTHGRGGASALLPAGTIVRRDAPAVKVVDTVGAGDAFTAGLLAWLSWHDSLRPGALHALPDRQVAEALDLANQVAALACTRPGADPPHRSDL